MTVIVRNKPTCQILYPNVGLEGEKTGPPEGSRVAAGRKPSSVPRFGYPHPGDGHSSGTAVTDRLVRLTRETRSGQLCPTMNRRTLPVQPCSEWGLPCEPCYHSPGALLPHLFTLTPPKRGGLFSAALSLGLPPPGVTRHPALWSSDFPPARLLFPATA
jgi:hypothetical protein